MQSFNQIREWISTLTGLFGDPKPLVDPKPFAALHAEERYEDMFAAMLPTFGVQRAPSFRLAEPGEGQSIAWTSFQKKSWLGIPVGKTVEVCIRRDFVAQAPFAVTLTALAHEISHVLLDSLASPLNDEEKAVDLVGMHMGYRGVWTNDLSVRSLRIILDLTSPEEPELLMLPWVAEYRCGYLSDMEIRYAKALMRT